MLFGVNINYSDLKNNDFNKLVSIAEKADINSVTVKLTNESDLDEAVFQVLSNAKGIKLNLEIPILKEFRQFALKLRPHACYIAPEKIHENTSLNGVNVAGQLPRIISFVGPLFLTGINTGILVSPDTEQIQAAANTGVRLIELHASSYFNSIGTDNEKSEFDKLKSATEFAQRLNLNVRLGRGLNYRNISKIKEITAISELNIGHAFALRALSVGFDTAAFELKELIG